MFSVALIDRMSLHSRGASQAIGVKYHQLLQHQSYHHYLENPCPTHYKTAHALLICLSTPWQIIHGHQKMHQSRDLYLFLFSDR